MSLKTRTDPRIVRAAGGSVNRRLADRAIRHAVYLERLKKGEARRISRFLAVSVVPRILESVEKVLEKRGSAPSSMQARLFELSETLRTVLRFSGEDQIGRLQNLAILEAEWQNAVLRESFPVEWSFRLPSAEQLVLLARQTPIQGTQISEIFSNLPKSIGRRVWSEISSGVALGNPNDEIVSAVRDLAIPQIERGVESLVRTSISEISNQTRDAVFRENKDVISEVQIVATLDDRTTFICMDYDGQVFPVDEGPRPPFHWNCRTTIIPVTKSWRELGVDLEEAPPGTRASMDGQVAVKTTYNEWLKNQPDSIQDDALGPVRAELFRNGDVDVHSFVNDGRVLTLQEIAAKEGIEEQLLVALKSVRG